MWSLEMPGEGCSSPAMCCPAAKGRCYRVALGWRIKAAAPASLGLFNIFLIATKREKNVARAGWPLGKQRGRGQEHTWSRLLRLTGWRTPNGIQIDANTPFPGPGQCRDIETLPITSKPLLAGEPPKRAAGAPLTVALGGKDHFASFFCRKRGTEELMGLQR